MRPASAFNSSRADKDAGRPPVTHLGSDLMSAMPREERLAAAFIDLADTLVGDFDVIAFLHSLTEHVTELLDVCAAGVVLAAPGGVLLEAAASDERTHRLELDSIDWAEGPCRDCYRSGKPVPGRALDDPRADVSWPRFAPDARALGFASVAATPLRLRAEVIGALSLFRDRPEPLDAAQLRLAQALADTATIGILQQRAVHEQTDVATHLQAALNSRIIIEQAKGALAARHRIGIEEAFHRLRRYARHHRRRLADIARAVVLDGLDPARAPETG
ncbi:GAF and ANTAR domain-containing protein [Streptomyces boninensis]|uniref:GAF and ANTAR domain-containing protein n=1 Tax=Streptomyces boninensis TaxID=2039455 RepID=UPI003B20B933